MAVNSKKIILRITGKVIEETRLAGTLSDEAGAAAYGAIECQEAHPSSRWRRSAPSAVAAAWHRACD